MDKSLKTLGPISAFSILRNKALLLERENDQLSIKVTGSGTFEDPYTNRFAGGLPGDGVVAIWRTCHSHRHGVIKVNSCYFTIEEDGVRMIVPGEITRLEL